MRVGPPMGRSVQHHACPVFPLTTTTFPVSYPLVMIILMTAVIRMRITNGQAQNAAAVRPHQGVLGPVHVAHAVTQMPEAFFLCPPTAPAQASPPSIAIPLHAQGPHSVQPGTPNSQMDLGPLLAAGTASPVPQPTSHLHHLIIRMPTRRSNTIQVRIALRVTTSTRHSLVSWRCPLLPPMALAKLGSKLGLDNGTEHQFRVDTPGGEVWIL